MSMTKRILLGLAALGLLLAPLAPVTLAQIGVNLGPGVEFLATERPNFSQSTVRVDTSQTLQQTIIGCETDRLATTTVNGLVVTGNVTGSGPTIQGKACTGGDTNRTLNLLGAGSGGITIANGIDSTVTGQVFLPAVEFCKGDAASSTLQNSLVPVRAASGDWSIQRTAAGAETINVHCSLDAWIQRVASSKGVRIDAFSIVQQITTLALTSNTFNGMNQVVYANNVADAVTACCGTITITMPTAVQANPYVTAATVGTPSFFTTAAASRNLDWTVVLQGTTVYSLKGVILTYTTALY